MQKGPDPSEDPALCAARQNVHARGVRGPLLEEMAEIILREIPSVALVVDVRLQKRQRIAAVRADVFERTGNGDHIRKMRDVGQETSDLRFRIDAGT